MLKLAEIKQIIVEQKAIFEQTDGAIERDILLDKRFEEICHIDEAVIITGVRRCGKSYLMRLIWKKIKKDLVLNKNDFLYINFESEKMLNFTVKNFDMLLEAYGDLFGIVQSSKIYLFFDEIQNITGWEKYINRLLEEKKYKIFITGSNASLLSKEIGTALTGRSFPLRLYPFSFSEFIRYSLGHDVRINDLLAVEQRVKVKNAFVEYITIGGFPEVVKNKFRPLLEEYLRNIIYRDIVLRHHIKYEASLREIVSFLTSHIGTPLSLKKISVMTRVKNIMTVKNYLTYLGDSFLFTYIHKHSFSVKQQIYNPDKVYSCDVGIYREVNMSPGDNEGRALENVVLNELTRRSYDVFYFSEKQECDFIVRQKNKVIGAVQVCRLLHADNTAREIGGLLAALQEYNLTEGLVLTEDEEDERRIDGRTIIIKPIYKWLLETSGM